MTTNIKKEKILNKKFKYLKKFKNNIPNDIPDNNFMGPF